MLERAETYERKQVYQRESHKVHATKQKQAACNPNDPRGATCFNSHNRIKNDGYCQEVRATIFKLGVNYQMGRF